MSARQSRLGIRQKPSEITRLMSLALERPDILSLAAGFTDSETLPVADVRAIVEEIASDEAEAKKALQYGANQGRGELRSLISERIAASDGLAEGQLDVDSLFITNGSQQALYLALQTLCDPGDTVLVEQPTYFVFLEILQGLGIHPMPMPMDGSGDVDVDALRTLLETEKNNGTIDKIKAVYLVSYFANPTGHTVSQGAKLEIGKLLREIDPGIAVIEDAAYRELYYDRPSEATSCLSMDAFEGLPVLYTSTLTKPYASGLKTGYAYCSDRPWLDSMLAIKGQQDFGTAHFTQAIVERTLSSDRFDNRLSILRSTYGNKMRTLHHALSETLVDLGWDWLVPDGGLYLWLKSPDGLSTSADSAFHEACLEAGVFYVPGDLCFAGGSVRDRIRLSFGVLNTSDLEEAASRFKRAAASLASKVA